MLRDEPMKIGLKIVQGNIPNNFKDQIVNVYLYHYDDELGMCIGCHSVNKESFYMVKSGRFYYNTFSAWERRDIYNRFFRNYLQTFFYSTLTKNSEINILVGWSLENMNYYEYKYSDKYILNIKKTSNDDIYFYLKDAEEDWRTEIKKVDMNIINKWMNRGCDEN